MLRAASSLNTGEVAVAFVHPSDSLIGDIEQPGDLIKDMAGHIKRFRTRRGGNPQPSIMLRSRHFIPVSAPNGLVEAMHIRWYVRGVGKLRPQLRTHADDRICANGGGQVDGRSEFTDCLFRIGALHKIKL